VKKIAIVIPTIREINYEYLKNIPKRDNIHYIIIDDRGDIENLDLPNCEIFNRAKQEKILGDYIRCIPQKQPGCRNFGFWWAWKEGYDIVITTDDDVVVSRGWLEYYEEFLGKYQEVLYLEGDKKFFNPISLLLEEKDDIYMRGYPYEERYYSKYNNYKKYRGIGKIISIGGLWDGVLDVNGLDKMAGKQFVFDGVSPEPSMIAYKGRFPISAMNWGSLGEFAPWMYHPPMQIEMTDGLKVDRHGDIWGSYIFESLASLYPDLLVVTGLPMVHHLKKGNLERETIGEFWGHLSSHYFYKMVDSAVDRIEPQGKTPAEVYSEMASNLEIPKGAPYPIAKLFEKEINCMRIWGSLLKRRE